MAMQNVGCDHNERPAPDRLASGVIGTDCDPADVGDRGIKANALFDYGARWHETLRETLTRTTDFAIRFGLNAVAPLRRLGQQEQRPAQRSCGRLMDGRNESEDVRSHLGQSLPLGLV